jgi:hypothetical protein
MASQKCIQCDHITCNIISESFSYIIHLHFIPWPMIDNPTSCDRIMYSSLIFHPKTCVKQSTFISHINEIVTKKASNKR